MPTKRDVLHLLTRDELLAIADAFEVHAEDRRAKDKLVDAVAASKKATLAAALPDLSRDRLKELCRALDLDDSGREKIVLVERLAGGGSATSAARAATNGAAASPGPPLAAVKPSTRRGAASKKNGGDLGFEATLWQAADKLRNNMDAAEYKHVVLGLIFLKYISDAFQERYRELEREVDDGADPEDPDEYRAKNIFWVPPEARWEKIQASAKKPTNGQAIDDAMTAIERANASLKGVLPKNYARPQLDKHRLGELIDLIATIGLGDAENRSKDILGRVYEYFLSEFASAEGKKGGQFYTPRSVVRVLVDMLAPYKGRVYDPCCGSGGMFVQSEKFIEEHGGRLGDISIYGQESNPTTWRLAKMNLAIRGIDADLGPENADSYHRDLHPDLKADFVLANPPFNDSDWGGDRLRDDVRWKYGVPPMNNANFAWVQHILHHLKPNGLAGVVLANGSLTTVLSGEGEIRKQLVESDLVDCVVALPAQLFYSTGIPACLWFLARNKRDRRFRERAGETLFIDARRLGYLVDRTHRELTESEIAQIVGAYRAWRDGTAPHNNQRGFCESVGVEQIRQNEYMLSPGRYVQPDAEPDEQSDVGKLEELAAQIVDLSIQQQKIDARIRHGLRALRLVK